MADAENKWQPENDHEWQQAKRIANYVLDVPFSDPDADISILARQLLRKGEMIDPALKADHDGR